MKYIYIRNILIILLFLAVFSYCSFTLFYLILQNDEAYIALLKQQSLDKILTYLKDSETLKSLGTVNVDIFNQPLCFIKHYYLEYTINEINIQNFMNTLDWKSLRKQHYEIKDNIINNVVELYIQHNQLAEERYDQLLLNNLTFIKETGMNCIIDHLNNNLIISTYKKYNLIKSNYFFDDISWSLYIKTQDFHTNMHILKSMYQLKILKMPINYFEILKYDTHLIINAYINFLGQLLPPLTDNIIIQKKVMLNSTITTIYGTQTITIGFIFLICFSHIVAPLITKYLFTIYKEKLISYLFIYANQHEIAITRDNLEVFADYLLQYYDLTLITPP